MDLQRPFSRSEAVATGISAEVLRGPRFRRIFRGIYVDASVPITPMLRAEAALAPFPDSAHLSHASAARLYDVPVPTLPEEHVTVCSPGDRRRRDGIKVHVAQPDQVRVVGGLRVSTCGDMFIELAELLPLVDLVVVGDTLVRRGWLTPAELVQHCAVSRRLGTRAARRAASYVRPRVDSPMETRLRMLIVLAGLPEPEVNVTIRNVVGEPIRRYDLSYRRSRTIVEYDGRHHIEREQQWESDLDRREAIDDDKWRILVVIAKGIYAEPERTLQRIHRVLRARGEPGVPAQLSDDWRPHFPGHR
ncbi:DUF559 domain-containing protein [Nocardioides limicola]|uniref:DUF559 domain-containing protein n=1 Tax=Nocardioides limicola TaxID=2803368 RepID=UPI00193B090A|nr:DUF559 domain-containing protein [Nocardioides sp. DJM-14]